MDKRSKIERAIVTLAPFLIGFASLLLVVLIIQLGKTSEQVSDTQAYTRVTNCVVSKVANPPTTQEAIELCYTQVEKDTGVHLQRFDTQERGDRTRGQE